jgi:hypothetical protein
MPPLGSRSSAVEDDVFAKLAALRATLADIQAQIDRINREDARRQASVAQGGGPSESHSEDPPPGHG